MTRPVDPDEAYKWYLIIQDFKASGLRAHKFCESNNIDYKKFHNKHYYICYKEICDPSDYEYLLSYAHEYRNSPLLISAFVLKHKLDRQLLRRMCLHLGYLEAVEIGRKNKEGEDMKFIQVQAAPTTLTLPQDAADSIKFIESPVIPVESKMKIQNNIEITIAHGVKVIISPNTESTKIIKIIDFLKDL